MTYQEFSAIPDDQKRPAEAQVGFIIRGGNVVGDNFIFCSTRIECVPLTEVRNLTYHDERSKE